jgi:hypothetical protein
VQKKRKVFLEIEHREISVSAGMGVVALNAKGQVQSLEPQSIPATCSACGGTETSTLAKELAELKFPPALLESGASGKGVHFDRTSWANGDLPRFA